MGGTPQAIELGARQRSGKSHGVHVRQDRVAIAPEHRETLAGDGIRVRVPLTFGFGGAIFVGK